MSALLQSETARVARQIPAQRRWLFSARADLGLFTLPAVAALGLVVLTPAQGNFPEWLWLGGILGVDVAHVWGTGLRVYADAQELRRRPLLYLSVPLLCWAGAAALYAHGALWFWRALAYAASFHFVRQQAGWMRLYQGAAPRGLGRHVDTAAIYAATLYPLIYWHTHVRAFVWMMPGDFVRLPGAAWDGVLRGLYAAILLTYAVVAAHRVWRGRARPGQDLLVLSTAACWYVGIVACNSDLAFTATNVLIHGIPYFGLIYVYGRHRGCQQPARSLWRLYVDGPWLMLGILLALAYAEEFLWDHALWHERPYLFGMRGFWDGAQAWLVPLLSVPQWTHYVLDGWVWRRSHNPQLQGLWSRAGKWL